MYGIRVVSAKFSHKLHTHLPARFCIFVELEVCLDPATYVMQGRLSRATVLDCEVDERRVGIGGLGGVIAVLLGGQLELG